MGSNIPDIEVVGKSSLLALVSAPNMITPSLKPIIVILLSRSLSAYNHNGHLVCDELAVRLDHNCVEVLHPLLHVR